MFGIKEALARSKAYLAVGRALDAGLSMSSALRLLEGGKMGTIESLMFETAADIERGSHFGEALRRRALPGQMPTEEVRLLEVGETSGTLPAVLKRVSARLEERASNRRILLAGLIYPTILLHMAIVAAAAPLIVSGLPSFLASVVPKLLVLWALALAVVVGLKIAARRKDGLRWLVDGMARLPLVGKAIKARAASEYAYGVGAGVSAGLPMPESIRLGAEVSRWTPLLEAAQRIARTVGGGMSLAQAHRLEKVMPRELVESIRVGEETGSLDEMLDGASRMLGDSASRRAAALAKGLPVAIYVLAAIYVGFVVISAYTGLLRLPGG